MKTVRDVARGSPGKPPATGREILGWCMFDFGNSSYTTVIVSVIFNRYFTEVIAPQGGKFLWGLSVWISMMLVVASAPVVGALADFSGAKKRFLAVTYLACVLATAPLAFTGPGTVALAMALFVVSNFFFLTGENIVAAFLPEISTAENIGRISGFGWALGYFGGLGSLLVCFWIVEQPGLGVPWCFPATAIFFLLAGLPTFLWVRERGARQPLPPGHTALTVGFHRVFQTLRHVRRYRQLFRFLLVFFFFNAGVMIVIAFASPYASEVVGMGNREILTFFIIVQVSAAAGAFVFGLLQDRMGTRWTIVITLVMWCAVCIGAYLFRTAAAFYAVGNLAGMAMGATQSASRALVGSFSPAARSAEFFGFWGLFWKLSGGAGPLLFGTVAELGGYPLAILSTAGLFVLGLAGMFWIDEEEGKRAAGDAASEPPGASS